MPEPADPSRDRSPSFVSRFVKQVILGLFRLKGWRAVGSGPSVAKGVIIAVPHTSNWDFVYYLGLTHSLGIRARFMAKDSLFTGAMGGFMRDMGGVPVERASKRNMVEQMVAEFAARDRFLDIMDSEAARMNRLIADLLCLSRVQAGERSRPAQHVDLAMLLREVLATMGPAAHAAGVHVESEGLDGTTRVPGDADQLVQVFQNLVDNALKYGGSGGWLGVRLARTDHEPLLRGPGWAVEIADRGDGIDGLHLPRLTERFYRVDAHRSRAQGGTGLGLAIVKHIVNRHRGRLKIDSQRGAGTTVTVILPETLKRL